MINYGSTLYGSQTLQEVADGFLAQLPTGTNLLLSRGCSGASLASAMLARYQGEEDLSHFYVRKPHEQAHTANWTGTRGHSDHAVVVDDLIDTGSTIEAILEFRHDHLCITHIIVGKIWTEEAAQAFATRWQKTIIEVDRARVTKPLKIEHVDEEVDNDETMQHGD